MNERRSNTMTLTAVAVGIALLGGTYGTMAAETQPVYESSIKVGSHNEGEDGESAMLTSLAKIDVTQAASAALAQVPGNVFKITLENEDGNLVYSVEIMTATNDIKDVKVDAGNARILLVDSGGEDNGIERDEGGDGDPENN